MIDKMKLHQWVDQLPETDQKTVFDFVEYLINRKKEEVVERFYYSLPEVDEPWSQEEERQIKENTGWMELEELERNIPEESK